MIQELCGLQMVEKSKTAIKLELYMLEFLSKVSIYKLELSSNYIPMKLFDKLTDRRLEKSEIVGITFKPMPAM